MKDWHIKTIVLGYDGSEGADRAADLASTVARQNNAQVLVVSVFEIRTVDTDDIKMGRIVGEARNDAEKAVRELRAAGIAAEPDVLEGSPGESLLRAADAHKADLVVVGRRGRGLLNNLLLGSTSEYVVRRAKIPVLVAH